MIKELPAKVFLIRVFCDKCNAKMNNYKALLTEPAKFEYTCKKCGNTQIEKYLPTYIVKEAAKEQNDEKIV